jgi:hypothetical protein
MSQALYFLIKLSDHPAFINPASIEAASKRAHRNEEQQHMMLQLGSVEVEHFAIDEVVVFDRPWFRNDQVDEPEVEVEEPADDHQRPTMEAMDTRTRNLLTVFEPEVLSQRATFMALDFEVLGNLQQNIDVKRSLLNVISWLGVPFPMAVKMSPAERKAFLLDVQIHFEAGTQTREEMIPSIYDWLEHERSYSGVSDPTTISKGHRKALIEVRNLAGNRD